MVEISEIIEDESQASPTTNNVADDRATERLSDADEIESLLLSNITRPSAKLHLENLITKLRKEGKALQRVAASQSSTTTAASDNNTSAAPSSDEPKQKVQKVDAPPTPPKHTPVTKPIITNSKYQSFPTYYFDAGKFQSPTVSVYVPLDNIGTHDKSKISCNFTSTSFDLVVNDFDSGNGKKSYRLLNDNLEHDIDVDTSKYVVKANKIIIKLGKVKGEYGSYDSWNQLTAKKKKKDKAATKDNPMGGIMDMMKDMYDNGDDQMKKMIGETMMKQRNGELNSDSLRDDAMKDLNGQTRDAMSKAQKEARKDLGF